MSVTASEARRTLFGVIRQVNDDRAPVHITSRRGNAVLVSAEDFASWQRTSRLVRAPATGHRAAGPVAEAEAEAEAGPLPGTEPG